MCKRDCLRCLACLVLSGLSTTVLSIFYEAKSLIKNTECGARTRDSGLPIDIVLKGPCSTN
jgi:hypothetical protein